MKKIKTVIVDDENRIRRGIEKLVLSCGEDWEVIALFGDGIELIEAYEKEPFEFDVLLTDIRMPVVDGLTLIKKMKKVAFFNPVVISGFDDFNYLQVALREGALDYILKPIDREEFKKQLDVLRQKVKIQWKEQEQTILLEGQARKLGYVKQVEKLIEATKGFEYDISLLDWTSDFPKGTYTLIQIAIDKPLSYSNAMPKEEWRTWILANENIIGELLQDSKRDFWKWRGEASCFWALLCSEENESEEKFKEEIRNFVHKLQSTVQNLLPFTNSVAISQSFEDLSYLQTIANDVLALMQYRAIFGNNQILLQDSGEILMVNHELRNAGKLQQLIQQIIQALERMNEEELKKRLSLFTDELHGLRLSSEAEFFLQSLSVQLINYVIKCTPRVNKDLLDIRDTANLLSKTKNIEELNQELESWVLAIYQKLSALNKEKVHNETALAKEWILQHLKDNITIEKIASHVYMNPTYFCECFKSETGETVLDFVTRSRISKARELILTTNLKVYEISEEVGYTDTKYFSKLFKKYYGELPSKYKEKLKA
ncbi:AraC family two component transcriptional regulator [Planomicrobium soli]|uniref:AraC family two component transcriptional regulator n=1 Tax=Planomicrobium soli TaxID=1176648 RepID=A0A2P8GQY1_9BACL|nr:helix-turn-helix domain-containing protein [Planomicrobium soli]PSL36362.1 AraC family two component transcriptional regulator [Planomicrobium soli]